MHWGGTSTLEPRQVSAITALLAPTTSFKPLVRDRIAEVNAGLLDLTSQQSQVLRSLRRNRRAMIFGGAGTGKTALALLQARSLASQGFRTLLTCFNAPLAALLAADVKDAPLIRATTFHSLCTTEARRSGISLGEPSGPKWWRETLPAALADSAVASDLRFDAIVVDEGQDFWPEWFSALQLLLEDEAKAPFYVFADAKQAIYVDGWTAPFDGAALETTVNCRNTRQIADASWESCSTTRCKRLASMDRTSCSSRFLMRNGR